jgi:hypothetical protein
MHGMHGMRLDRAAPLALAWALGLAACGEKSLEQRKQEERALLDAQFAHVAPEARPMSEAEKIERLVDLVRESGHTFIRNGQEHDSHEAAEHLSMKLERAGDRVHTADDFIAGIATRSSLSGQLYQLRTADGTEYATRDWLVAQLQAMEKPPPPTASDPVEGPNAAPVPAPRVVTTIDIDFSLSVIESSGLGFLAPHEDKAATHYTAGEFARMLRRKSKWLGPDLNELDPWLDEIASRSFKTDLPYQVQLEGGEVVELRPWLDEQLAKARRHVEGAP